MIYYLLYSKTDKEHNNLLEKFIEIIEKCGISLSQKKAGVFKNQVDRIHRHRNRL